MILISFSGRQDGNCDQIAKYIAGEQDKIVFFRELDIHPCSGCDYECFREECVYRADAIYGLYDEMCDADRVVLLVPMYGGNPSSLYFLFNERGQDFFCHSDAGVYEKLLERLYIIGIYGEKETAPDFVPCLEKWFSDSSVRGRVLGIERHRYGQKLSDRVLELPQVRDEIKAFLNR